MTDTKFTEGPWIAEKGVGWCVTRPNARDRKEAALAVGMTPATTLVGSPGGKWFDEDECEANAHLIAAAPDLYDLVSLCAAIIDGAPGDLCDRMQSALAKARGEQA